MAEQSERADLDTIIAHVGLLRAVDHCLADAEELSRWREEAKQRAVGPPMTPTALAMPAASIPATDAPALTLSAADLARELRCSTKSICRMDQSGKLPAAVRVGQAKRWLRSTIVAWLEAGCPSWRACAAAREPDPPALFDFPRLWRLFGFMLSKQTRERIFAPEYEDFVAEFQWAHEEQYNTRWARWWLNFAFTVRTAKLIARCCRPAILAAAVALLVRFIPPQLKQYIHLR